MEFQGVNEALENDGGDNIDHSHMPPILLETESSSLSNLDTESILCKSRTRQQPKLPTGFEYAASLTTVFFSGYEAGVQDLSTYHEAMIGANTKELKLGCDDEFHSLDVNNTWKHVPRPRGQTVLGGKCVFKTKQTQTVKLPATKHDGLYKAFVINME